MLKKYQQCATSYCFFLNLSERTQEIKHNNIVIIQWIRLFEVWQVQKKRRRASVWVMNWADERFSNWSTPLSFCAHHISKRFLSLPQFCKKLMALTLEKNLEVQPIMQSIKMYCNTCVVEHFLKSSCISGQNGALVWLELFKGGQTLHFGFRSWRCFGVKAIKEYSVIVNTSFNDMNQKI